jgi:hypothetical protein
MALATLYPGKSLSPSTTITADNGSTITVADGSKVRPDNSTFPALITIGYDTATPETIEVSIINTNTLTVTTRAVEGTQRTWPDGTNIAIWWTAKHLLNINSNIIKLYQMALDDKYNVFDYGLVADGSTDNSSAMNALVTVVTNAGGGIIYFPPGRYCMSNISINSGSIYLEGCAAASIIVNNSTNHPAVTFGNGTTMIYNVGIEDLLFGQKTGVTPVSGNCGVYFNKCGFVILENVLCDNYPSALYDGFNFQGGCSNVKLVDCGSVNTLHNGIITNLMNDMYATNCNSDGNANIGWYHVDMNGSYFDNCTAYSNSVYGWNLLQGSALYNINGFFINCVGDSSGQLNWDITNATNMVFTNCWGCTQESPATTGYVHGFYVGSSKHIDFIGCKGYNNNGYGVYVTGSRNISFIGGNFYNNNQCTTQAYGCGIGIIGASSYISVVNADCLDDQTVHTQYYGINVTSDCSYITLKDNQATGNTSAQINNASTTGFIIHDNQGYITEKSSTATILNNGTSIVVAHGLAATPTKVFVIGSTADTSALYVDTIESTNFTIHSTATVSGDRKIYWRAEV